MLQGKSRVATLEVVYSYSGGNLKNEVDQIKSEIDSGDEDGGYVSGN